jgi:hypothetical protein
MSTRELDELFRSSEPGPDPAGRAEGTVLFMPGTPLASRVARVLQAVAWQGKVVDPGGAYLKNLVTPLHIRAVKASIYRAPSWLDRREAIVIDYSRTSLVARAVRDEIREVAPGLYLGLVFLSGRLVLRFSLHF